MFVTSTVTPFRNSITSSGRYASSLIEFSAHASSATTGTLGLITFPMISIAPNTPHPPSLSRFMPFMPPPTLMDRPPESYVIVFPISTIGFTPRATRAGRYSSRIMHGLFSLALPTLIRPVIRSSSSFFPLITVHFRPALRAIAFASRAIQSGVAMLGGVWLRRRAVLLPSASPRPRRTPFANASSSDRRLSLPRAPTVVAEPRRSS